MNLEHSTISADTSIRAGYELGKALVRSNRLKKVICCTYDMTALGLTTALSEENIVVGKDVEILTTSSSDDDLLAYSNPPITVVDLKFRDLCYMAMRLGMDIATGRASYPQEISLHPTIIYRKSCPGLERRGAKKSLSHLVTSSLFRYKMRFSSRNPFR